MIRLFDAGELSKRLAAVAAVAAATLVMSPAAFSQEKQDGDTAKADAAQETATTDEEEKPDPFAVPEGTIEELKAFVVRMQTYRAPVKSRAEAVEQQKKTLAAIVTATSRILEAAPNEEMLIFATENQFNALTTLVRVDPTRGEQLEKLLQQLDGHPIKALARLPVLQRLRTQLSLASRMPAQELETLAEEMLAFIDQFGIDPTAVSMASSLGRYMGYAGATEAGAAFYERVGAAMETSDVPAIANRAAKMIGGARLLRLPGKPIEVFGNTPDGSEFDWTSYRGKVVLVDFWASWCGPCIGELPNMKHNLSRYGDKGFTIVGINLDSTRNAFEKCIADKEITWANLLGDADDAGGWDHPMATYYGISAIPTAILVDKEGKVVSLRARGKELDRLLEEILGPIEEPESPADPEKTSTDSDK